MAHKKLAGKKILVLGGAPRERVDPFRFYYNDSRSPAQAAETAKALSSQGAEVTLLAPAAHKFALDMIRVVDHFDDGRIIESAADMLEASAKLVQSQSFDAVMQLASISGIACPVPSDSKIQKTDQSGQLFNVVGNIEVRERLKNLFPSTTVVGYGTDHHWFTQGDKEMAATLEGFVTHGAQTITQPPATQAVQQGSKLEGKKIVVTTSRTEEKLTVGGDIITNFFSGRQGQALARIFADMGAEVVLVSGPTHLADVSHPHVKTLHVQTAREMHRTCMNLLESPVDVFIGAAAVADFGIDKLADVPKEGEVATLSLSENPSIVGDAAHANEHPMDDTKPHPKRPRVVVSFAAQSPQNIVEYAQKKFHKLGVDFTVANPIGNETIAARDPSQNQVMLIDGEGILEFPPMKKEDVAGHIATEVCKRLMKAKPIMPHDPLEKKTGELGR